MKVRQEILENKSIYIIDGEVQTSDIEEFYSFVKNLSFKRNERDHDEDMYPIFSIDFKPNEFESETVIGQVAITLLNKFYPNINFHLFRSYINMSHYGDLEYPHRDCSKNGNDLTILYYVNKKWDYKWGGETLFYEDGDTKIAVIPNPGRFVIFPGAIEHMGTIPTRACNESRFSLALKYKVVK